MSAARAAAAIVAEGDELVVVWDEVFDELPDDDRRCLQELGIRVHDNGRNCGLSASRNWILAECASPVLVFIDDDVAVPRSTIEGFRDAFANGAGVVGCRIEGDLPRPLPWWISEGQLHLLAIHSRVSEPSIWGACFAFDVALAHQVGLRFDGRLGRRGKGLESGDDTTFVASLVEAGGTRIFLAEHTVVHRIPLDRLRFRYVARRSFWQGRSEFRRGSVRAGLRKELRRASNRDVPIGRRLVLGFVYIVLAALGATYEAGSSVPARLRVKSDSDGDA